MKPDGTDRPDAEVMASAQDGADGGKPEKSDGVKPEKPSLIRNVLLAATGQGGRRAPDEAALEDAERRAEASAKEAIRAAQAALAAQETARKAADEAAMEARKASQAALAAQAALKEAQAAKVAIVARKAADRAAEKAADEAARAVAREAAREAAIKAAELVVRQTAARGVAEKAAEAAALEAAQRAAREAAGREAQIAARRAADDAAKEAAKEAAQQAAEKAAKEAQAVRIAEADKIARATRAARAAKAARAARAEKFAKRASEKTPSQPLVRQKRLNVKLAVAVPVIAAVLVVGVYVLHAVQIGHTATVMLNRADKALEEGKKDEAVRFLTHYVKYQRDDNEVFSRLALLVAERAKGGGANPDALWTAYKMLNSASANDSENWDVRRNLVDVCIKVGRTEEAANQLRALCNQFPNDASLAVKLGRCQTQLEKTADAVRTFQRVTAQDPKNLEAHVALADLLRDKLDNPDTADAEINQMVASNSQSVKAYLERARYWHRGKSINSANDDIRHALEMAPDDSEVLVTAAQFAKDNKDYEQAKEYLDKAEALHAGDAGVEKARMVLNLTLGETGKVRSQLEEQIKTGKSSDAGDLLTFADVQLKEGDLAGVRDTIGKMRTRGFREEIVQFYDARVQVAEGKWRSASSTLERLRPNVTAWPEFLTQVDLFLGACYEQLRLPDRQLNIYRDLLNRDADLDAARAGYASALFRTGKLDEAAAEYEKLKRSMKDEFLKSPALRNNLFQLIVARTMRLPESYRDWTDLEKYVENLSKVDGVDEVQLALMRAEVLAKKGDNKKARELVDAMLAKHGKDVGLWNASAKLAAMTSGPQEGLRVLDAAVGAAGNDPAFALSRADLAARLGAEKGVPVLDALAADVEKLPELEKVRMWRSLGAAYYRLRDREKARQYWQRVADSPQRDPQILLVLFELARESGNERQMDEAVEAVRSTLGRRSSEAYYCESSELIWKARQNKIDKRSLASAKQMLAQAATERPSWHEIPRLQAEIALLENQPDEAIKQFQRASELGPLSPVYLGQLVQLLYARGRYQEARDVIGKLGGSEFSLTMKRLEAELNFRLGDLPQALELASQAVKKSDRATDFLWYGELLARTRKYAEAQQQFRKAVELDPKIPQAWVGLVALLVEEDKKEEAQRAVRQAQASLPEDETALVLAQCYHLLGDLSRSEQFYLSALAQHPEDLSVIRYVARFYMLTGRSEEARRYLGQILTLAGRDPKQHQGELVEARRWMARVLAAEGDWRQLQQGLALLDRNAEDGQLPLADLRLKAGILAARSDHQSRQQAIRLLEKIRDERKKDFSAQERFALAQLYDKTGSWPLAQEQMRELIRANPKEPTFLAAYVQMMFDHGSEPSTIDYSLGKLEKLAPEAASTRFLKAKSLAKEGKSTEAVALLKALVPKPLPKEKVGALRQVAAWLEQIEQYDAARELLDEFATRVPGGSLVVAAFLGRHGTTDEALDQVDKALQDNQVPIAAALRVVVAVFSQKRKDGKDVTPAQFARAEAWFKRAVDEAPYDKIVQLQTAALRDLQNNYPEQIKIYRQFLARDDVTDHDKAIVWNNLAFLLAASGEEKKEALKMANQAIELLGPMPELLDTRAVALVATGDYQAAIADLKQAMAENASGILYFHLAQAYQGAGNRKGAESAMQTATSNYRLNRDNVPSIERDTFQKLVAALKSP